MNNFENLDPPQLRQAISETIAAIERADLFFSRLAQNKLSLSDSISGKMADSMDRLRTKLLNELNELETLLERHLKNSSN